MAMATQQKQTADAFTESADHIEMARWLRKIEDVLAGEECIKAAGEKYLPRWKKENAESYRRRLAATPWWPGFADAVENITGKPFASPLAVEGDDGATNAIGQKLSDVTDDVDGAGNGIHVFARDLFADGIANGMAGILVDFPADGAEEVKTLADERKRAARPYWAHIKAGNILACYFESVGGRQFIRHLRFRECYTEQDGYGEKSVERVRVMEPGRFEVWERSAGGAPLMVESGKVTLPIVPFVPFYAGKRFGNYGVKPPLLELANKNISIFQKLSRKEQTFTLAGFPMLKIKGASESDVGKTRDDNGKAEPEIEVGPGITILLPRDTDGTTGDADFISPEADVLTEIRNDVEADIKEFLRLAKQPMMPGSGTTTATANALEASKANSAISTWALALKDALDQALAITCAWMNLKPTATVSVPTDFTSDMRPDSDVQVLLTARAQREISLETFWGEWKRRGMLSADFDPAQELHRLETDSAA